MDKAQSITEPEEEIYIDPNMQIGLTGYAFKDLPKWAKDNVVKQLIEEKKNENRNCT